MKRSWTKQQTQHTSILCVTAALAVLLLPLPWLFACAFAAAFHEMCHLLMLRLITGKWYPIHLQLTGARISIPAMRNDQELLCALAGPIGGLLLAALTVAWLPMLALCATIQSLFNLLPIYPMDGARGLRCALAGFLPSGYTQFLCAYLEAGCLAALFLLTVYLTVFAGWGIGPMILFIVIFGRRFLGIWPCKTAPQGLQ